MTEPLAPTDWGWSNIVALVETREQAVATIGLLAGMREIIGESLEWWASVAHLLPDLTREDWTRIQARDFPADDRGEACMRGLKPIALNPRARAIALLALDVHIAYLRGAFAIQEE